MLHHLVFFLLFLNYGKVVPKTEKNGFKIEKIENVLVDNITEAVGNSQEVEVIDGNYSGNETQIRTARRYYGGRFRGGFRGGYYGRRSYGWGGWGRRRYYSYYSPRYYGGYYSGYYGYGGYGYSCYWIFGCYYGK